MTRNFTILFLTLLLCACTKDETGTPIRATYQTEYEDGKTYVQTFYLSELSNGGICCLWSDDGRLKIELHPGRIDQYLRFAPNEDALAKFLEAYPYGSVVNTYDLHPLLVVELRFSYHRQKNPSEMSPYLLKNVSCVGRWRLVEAIKVRYDMDGSERFREEIQSEVCSFPFRPNDGNKNAPLDNSVTEYRYGEWYRQDFQLMYSSKNSKQEKPSPEFNDILCGPREIIKYQIITYTPAEVVPAELIRQLKSLCTNQEVPAEGFDRVWGKQENDAYRIRAEHLFRYPGPHNLMKEYLERKSDWKLERLTFDSSVRPPKFEWIAYDGIDPREKIVGQWKTADNTPVYEAVLLQLQADGWYKLTIEGNTTPQTGRYTLQNNTLNVGYTIGSEIRFNKTGNAMTFRTRDNRTVILYRQ